MGDTGKAVHSEPRGQMLELAGAPSGTKSRSRLLLHLPMLVVQVYLTLTVLLFALGPWPWPVRNPLLLYSFLACSQLLLWWGYRRGLATKPARYTGRWTAVRLFDVSLLVGVAWAIPSFLVRTGVGFDPTSAYSRILLGLAEPGVAYGDRIQMEGWGETPVLLYVSIILAPLLQLLLPVGMITWSHLSLVKRITMLLVIAADMAAWVATGTNKGLADLLLLVPFYWVMRSPSIVLHANLRRLAPLALSVAMGIYAFGSFFSAGALGRAGSPGLTMEDFSTRLSADESNVLLAIVPADSRGSVASFCSYVTQGYYGLSLSLDEPFEWSYGMGHSYYLPSWLKKVDRSWDIASRSYPGRVGLRTDWSYLHRWHSIYPWLASDLTFPGALVVMFLLGALLARVWQDAVLWNNPLAAALCGVVLIALFYVPANNQVWGFPASSFTFWTLFFWWSRTRTAAQGGGVTRSLGPS